MITKGIVEEIVDNYNIKIRLPAIDGIKDSKYSTSEDNLSIATICSFAKNENSFQIGDIVFVGFEDNDLGKPIILGHLARNNMQETKLDTKLNSLNVLSTTFLPYNTSIGNVNPYEISTLDGSKENIQKQITSNKEKIEYLNLNLKKNLSITPQLKNNGLKNKGFGNIQDITGYHIWTDGQYVYYDHDSTHLYMHRFGDTGVNNTNISFEMNGAYVGKDYQGDIYYSAGTIHKKYNPTDWTGESITGNGLSNFIGNQIGTDGVDIYYSDGIEQYRLNPDIPYTGEKTTGNGLTKFEGIYIGTDNINIYYSYETTQYRLKHDNTHTWEKTTGNGLNNFDGAEIGTDGVDIYYSDFSEQYRLKHDNTHTGEAITGNGLTSFIGDSIGTNGIDIYYNYQGNNYRLGGRITRLHSI